MSISVDVWVHCDRCYRTDHADRTADIVRKHLRTVGWTRPVVDGRRVDLCPTCTQLRKEDPGTFSLDMRA